ncbi:MAG: hypothetical protein MR763_10795 [Clostridiales bacterium]|nr:hypothetical protein [Clostridiales bacterium]
MKASKRRFWNKKAGGYRHIKTQFGLPWQSGKLLGTSKKLPFWVLDGSFVPTMRFEKAAIHQVFRPFQNFCWNKISHPKHQKIVFRGRLLFVAV